MMCLLNVCLVCNLAIECKKDVCQKQSAYTLSMSVSQIITTFINIVTLES